MATSSIGEMNHRLNCLRPSDHSPYYRLTAQHEVLRHTLNGHVILAPVNITVPLFVLDAGTGPGKTPLPVFLYISSLSKTTFDALGLWIQDASTMLSPSSVLHGVDLNEHMLPRIRPINTSFSVMSILDFPHTWNGKFDLVHQRLLVWALSTEEWHASLQGAYRVLTNGGWIQIGEPGSFHSGGKATARVNELMRQVLELRGLRGDIATIATSLLVEVGFEKTERACFPIKLGALYGNIGALGSRVLLGALKAMKPLVVQAGGLGLQDVDREFSELMTAAQEEWDDVGTTVDFWVFCARKPHS